MKEELNEFLFHLNKKIKLNDEIKGRSEENSKRFYFAVAREQELIRIREEFLIIFKEFI